jgi:molecular chaperone DnaJ
VAAQVEIELVEAANGATRSVPVPVALPCDVCAGSGVEPGKQAQTCETCGGAGQIAQVSRNAFGEFRRVRACPSCRGSGVLVMYPCRACEGSGSRRADPTHR